MKLIGAALCSVVVFGAAELTAQSQTQTTKVETKSKITVDGGKSVEVTGCVAPMLTGTGLMLTNVADKSGALRSYFLVSDDPDLAKHVGHRLQLKGKVTDRGDARVTIETKTRTKVENGNDKETKSKTELDGDAAAAGWPYLAVESMKMIAAACP